MITLYYAHCSNHHPPHSLQCIPHLYVALVLSAPALNIDHPCAPLCCLHHWLVPTFLPLLSLRPAKQPPLILNICSPYAQSFMQQVKANINVTAGWDDNLLQVVLLCFAVMFARTVHLPCQCSVGAETTGVGGTCFVSHQLTNLGQACIGCCWTKLLIAEL